MRRVLILALMMSLFASNCYALGGARLRMAGQSCTLPVTRETGDTDNYFSSWSLAGGSCGTIYYSANWDDYTLDWAIHLYSDAGMTRQIGAGSGTALVAISGVVNGTVMTGSAGASYLTVQGTLTR